MTIAKAIALPAERPGVGATEVQFVPFDVSTLAAVPGATDRGADVPLPNRTLFRVRVVVPVPPFDTERVPVAFATGTLVTPAALALTRFLELSTTVVPPT